MILSLVAVQLSAMLNAIGEGLEAAAAWSNFQESAGDDRRPHHMALVSHAAYVAGLWGVLDVAGFAQLIFIYGAGAREGLIAQDISWPRWTPEIREGCIAFGAVTFGSVSIVVSPFIDTIIASWLPTGSRTALYYADRIN